MLQIELFQLRIGCHLKSHAVGGSFFVTLVLFFRTPDQKSVILDFFVIDNSFDSFALRSTSFHNSADDG